MRGCRYLGIFVVRETRFQIAKVESFDGELNRVVLLLGLRDRPGWSAGSRDLGDGSRGFGGGIVFGVGGRGGVGGLGGLRSWRVIAVYTTGRIAASPMPYLGAASPFARLIFGQFAERIRTSRTSLRLCGMCRLVRRAGKRDADLRRGYRSIEPFIPRFQTLDAFIQALRFRIWLDASKCCTPSTGVGRWYLKLEVFVRRTRFLRSIDVHGERKMLTYRVQGLRFLDGKV